jgi:protein-disulfide isomerase
MESKTQTPIEKIATPVALLLGLLAIAGAIYFGSGEAPTRTSQQAKPAESAPVSIETVQKTVNPMVGSKSAPVTLAVWFDFQCRFCKLFESNAMKSVVDEYVKAGKVAVVYKDYQFLGEQSIEAGVFSRAVYEVASDKWYDWFHDVMAGAASTSPRDTASLVEVAKKYSIDTEKVLSLASSKKGEYLSQMESDEKEGAAFGITGTPATIVGTTLIKGAKPFDEVQVEIEALLK